MRIASITLIPLTRYYRHVQPGEQSPPLQLHIKRLYWRNFALTMKVTTQYLNLFFLIWSISLTSNVSLMVAWLQGDDICLGHKHRLYGVYSPEIPFLVSPCSLLQLADSNDVVPYAVLTKHGAVVETVNPIKKWQLHRMTIEEREDMTVYLTCRYDYLQRRSHVRFVLFLRCLESFCSSIASLVATTNTIHDSDGRIFWRL